MEDILEVKKVEEKDMNDSVLSSKNNAKEKKINQKSKKNNKKTQNNDDFNEKIVNFNETIENKDKTIRMKNKALVGLSIATIVLGATAMGFGIAFAVTDSKAMQYGQSLENVYRNNFYSLLDSVNNLENKISKTLTESSSTYQRKTLLEASKNASEAEIAVASLPLSQSDINDIIKLVNQISGYTSTLADKLVTGEGISSEEYDSLRAIHENVLQLKQQLNEYERKLDKGLSILDSSLDIDNDTNGFSKTLSITKNNNVEYPTMIYDGPFSDSVVNSTVKGLTGNKISKSDAMRKVEQVFKNTTDIDYEAETKGRFETYNFRVTTSNNEQLFVQATMIEGHILTISGAGADDKATEQIDKAAAKDIALEFAKENGVEDGEVVWSDSIGDDFYLNIAPKDNGIILYPDLVKVKISLSSGLIVGYDATSYFTNHTTRTLNKGSLSLNDAKGKTPADFEIINSRLVLSPLDYNREVVCVEVEAEKDNSTYYFYYNAQNGDVENVLKVIKTDNGSLLM